MAPGERGLSSPSNGWIKRFSSKNARVALFIVGVLILIIQLWRFNFADKTELIKWTSLNGPTFIAIIFIIISLSPILCFHLKNGVNICKNHVNLGNPVLISIIVLIFFLSHLLWPERIALDAVILGLLVIMIIPWLPPLIKYLELPGGLKIQFSEDIRNVAREVTEAGLIPSQPANGIASIAGGNEESNKSLFERIVDEDPAIALAGLRIEIERRLVRLAQYRQINASRMGISRLLPVLNESEILSDQETHSLKGLIRLLNSASHGADIRKEDALIAIDMGINILNYLDNKIANLNAQLQSMDVA